MITRPLDLVARMSPPPRDLDFVAWVNVGVIVLFFSLLGSRFVLAPGPRIELPNAFSLTEGAGAPSVVVSYRRNNVILFEGGMYSLAELRKHLAGYAKSHPGTVMLVRADRQVSVQDFFDLCGMAREVGFAGVQAAAEPPAH
jgi:biopolymer transport protein ExbD